MFCSLQDEFCLRCRIQASESGHLLFNVLKDLVQLSLDATISWKVHFEDS